MEKAALNNFIEQVTRIYIEPEIKRRNFTGKIFAFLILMKEDEPTKVLLNTECPFEMEVDITGTQLKLGESLSLKDLAQYRISNIRIPKDIFDDYAFIAAFTINNKWTLKLSFLYNKKEAITRAERAKNFLLVAQSSNDKAVKSYNLFHALEQAIHSYFMFRPGMKAEIMKMKKHNSIGRYLKRDADLGNFPKDLKTLFDKLLNSRKSIYDSGIPFEPTDDHFKLVDKFIEQLRERGARF